MARDLVVPKLWPEVDQRKKRYLLDKKNVKDSPSSKQMLDMSYSELINIQMVNIQWHLIDDLVVMLKFRLNNGFESKILGFDVYDDPEVAIHTFDFPPDVKIAKIILYGNFSTGIDFLDSKGQRLLRIGKPHTTFVQNAFEPNEILIGFSYEAGYHCLYNICPKMMIIPERYLIYKITATEKYSKDKFLIKN